MYATRPTLYGTRHAVSAGHYLAASAGFAVLEAGGNAIDAGCAAGIALGVLLPDLVNVAGVAPILIRKADGTVETIAGLGHWPRGIPADLFMREHGGRIPNGVLRTVVPAAPDAWITALERHGTMGFADVAQYAIRYARDGFAVYPLLADNIRDHEADYARWPGNAAIFLPGGRRPQVGERFVQSDLAATLQYMADEEAKAAGKGRLAGLAAAHAAFYRGDIAREIAAFMRREGGYLTMEDLAGYRSRLEPAVRRPWRGHEVITCGPWCQGPALLEALLLMEKGGIAGLAHNSAEYLHLLTECIKAAMADREYHFGDPAFLEVPVEALLSDAHLAARLAEIDPDRALPGMPGPILNGGTALPGAADRAAPLVEADTSYCCVVDRWGNAFSATPSDGSWNSPVVPGLGLIPSNRGSQSRPDPAHPCGVAPGKRPRLTPNPAMVVTAEGGVMPFGTPGGDVQIQAMIQVLLNILQHGMEVQEAIEAPRVASYSFPSSFAPFDFFPGRLAVEEAIPKATRDALAAKGHDIRDWPAKTWLAGTVEVVKSDPATGLLAAGADPRRPAYAVVG
ncbi:gamma-glutamyltransferase family protein [Paracraurococcus lichenis]|uniref:Gamma-glutamyltransferase n=1 Tax=Paracraurococcus lichenis TaxID=3064888 RepID=A0ABT9DZU5_9PROT|nr:gamma-glutamyltransferase [Paracraurococcus sp. LOR1-02]MDO9709409.1 gamma-glutamyltransferase [Paracraurococcus sp. LOR1-02]